MKNKKEQVRDFPWNEISPYGFGSRVNNKLHDGLHKEIIRRVKMDNLILIRNMMDTRLRRMLCV